MAVTLQVSDVRREIYTLAGGVNGQGNGAASTALLGRIFHDAFAELVGDDRKRSYHHVISNADNSLEDWKAALIKHTYRRLIGPRLQLNQAALSLVPERTLTFWDATQELCCWVAELLWQAQEKGLSLEQPLLVAEQQLSWELRDENWTDSVRLIGSADAVCQLPDRRDWCLIELKTGRTAPEADLAQACLYHQMLKASDASVNGALALVSFQPQRHEQVFAAETLIDAQSKLQALIGRMAGVASSVKTLPGSSPQVSEPLSPVQIEDYHNLGRELERVFLEYGVSIKAHSPTIGPSFLRYPVELGRRVIVSSLRRYIDSVQVKLELSAPPRITNEGGRLSIDLRRPDRQTVYFSSIKDQLPARDPLLGNSKAPIGIGLNGDLITADLSHAENAHFFVAGTTGSGKSEWLRSFMAGLIMTNSADSLRFALADPKRNAFQLLAKSPFLFSDIAYDETATLLLLEKLVSEMEDRYVLMATVKADNLTDYIRITQNSIPRIVFMCDEFADLMTCERSVRSKLEGLVRRLGNKARAAGIHLVLATQQPSRQVTSGPILTVMTAKIVLRMDNIASRILLGDSSAESLLGKGDLLYKCIGDPVRLQSPYLPAEELKRVFATTG